MQGWSREKYHSSVLLLSQSWFHLLHSPSCRVKGFALMLGSTQRDFLKLFLVLGSLLSATSQNSLSRKQCDLHKQGTNSHGARTQCGAVFPPSCYRTDVSCSSLFKCLWHFGISLWLDCDLIAQNGFHKLVLPLYTLTFGLLKFVFTSLFPLCASHIYFVHMETAAGSHPSCGTVITVWSRS